MKKKRMRVTVTVSNQELIILLKKITTEQQMVVSSLQKLLTSGGRVELTKIVARIKSLQTLGIRNSTLAKFSSIALGQVFLFFKENWGDLPEEFIQAYTEGPYGYIQQVYGYGAEMADMYSKVWLAFYSGQFKFKLPNYVRLGALPVAKMNTAAAYILRDEMTTDRWKVLADETLTRSELSMQLRNADVEDDTRPSRGPKVGSTRATVSRETGDVRMYISGKIETVGFLNFESANPLVLDEIRRICKEGRIKVMQ